MSNEGELKVRSNSQKWAYRFQLQLGVPSGVQPKVVEISNEDIDPSFDYSAPIHLDLADSKAGLGNGTS